MSSIVRLKKNWQFKRVYNEGKYSSDKYVVTYYNRNKTLENVVGFSVSKKVGNSVIRNKTKRRMRESYRALSADIKKGFDIVFTARVAAANINHNEILSSMTRSLERAKLLNKLSREK